MVIAPERPQSLRWHRLEEQFRKELLLKILRKEKKAAIDPTGTDNSARDAYLNVADNFIMKLCHEHEPTKTRLVMPPTSWSDFHQRLSLSPTALDRLIKVEEGHNALKWRAIVLDFILSQLEQTVQQTFRVSDVKHLSLQNASAAISRVWTLQDCSVHRFDPMFLTQLRDDYNFCFPPDTGAQAAAKASELRWCTQLLNMLPSELRAKIHTYNLESPGADPQAFTTLLEDYDIRALNLLELWRTQISPSSPSSSSSSSSSATSSTSHQKRFAPRRTATVAAVATPVNTTVASVAPFTTNATPSAPPPTQQPHMYCHSCNRPGHSKATCSSYLCHGCNNHAPGHTWRACPVSPFPRKADGTSVNSETGKE